MRQEHQIPDFRRTLRLVAQLGVLVAFVLLFLHLKVSVKIHRDYRPYIFDSTYDLPGPEVLRALSLNHRTAAADLLWVDAVQFVARATVARRTADEVTFYADSITQLDPYFHKVYSWHSASRMLIAGYPSPEDIEASNDILERGMKYFPGDWRLPYEAAANYIGFNRGVDDETRRKQLERGLWFARKAAEHDGAPETMILLATRFQNRQERMEGRGDTSAAGDFAPETLIQLYLLAESERVRRSILLRLRQRDDSDKYLSRLRALDAEFEREYRRFDKKYLPRDLFLLLSPTVQSSAGQTSARDRGTP